MASDLTLASYSDRELLFMLGDLGDNEGWVENANLGAKLGLPRDGRSDSDYTAHVNRSIGVRMAWIKKLSGCVEYGRDKDDKGRWRLTERGRAVTTAKLTTAAITTLAALQADQNLLVMEGMGNLYRAVDVQSANLLRRQWAHSSGRRS